MVKKKSEDLSQQFEDWKTKGEKREEKKQKEARKIPVHSGGLYEIWKLKMEKAEKQAKKEKDKPKKKNK